MAEGQIKAALTQKLGEALNPDSLAIADESALHQGHAGARPGGETHFRVEIVAKAFEGLSRIERQRLIYGILSDELAGPVHALSVAARTPDEDARSKKSS